jgi:hypothetical protein
VRSITFSSLCAGIKIAIFAVNGVFRLIGRGIREVNVIKKRYRREENTGIAADIAITQIT